MGRSRLEDLPRAELMTEEESKQERLGGREKRS